MEITVLVADDMLEIIRDVAFQLNKRNDNIKVINANNGEIAFKIAQKAKPNLILMDWDMPVMNGIESMRLLKNSEETFDIPVIISNSSSTKL